MADKKEEFPPGCSSSGVCSQQLDSSQPSSLDSKTVNDVHSNSSFKEPSQTNSLPLRKSSKDKVPMLSSGPEARERLKFILGASEDNSSDEEPLVTKPPSCTPLPSTSTPQNAEIPQSTSMNLEQIMLLWPVKHLDSIIGTRV